MEVTATADVVTYITDRGGRLFVWPHTTRCCNGPMTFFHTGVESPDDIDFDPVPCDGFDLYLARGMRRPGTLDLELKGRRRRRVEAYPDGLAYRV